jgi:hypothetical protein
MKSGRLSRRPHDKNRWYQAHEQGYTEFHLFLTFLILIYRLGGAIAGLTAVQTREYSHGV